MGTTSKQGDEHEAASTYGQLGRVAHDGGDLRQAEEWYRKSLAIFQKQGDEHLVAIVYHQLGRIAHEGGDLGQAEEWHRKSLAIFERQEDEHLVAVAYYQLGRIAHEGGDLGQAEEWYRKSLAIEQKQGDEHGAAITHGQLGRIAQERGDLGQAEEWHCKSLAIFQKQGDEHGAASTYGQLGRIAQERGDLGQAEEWHRKSLAIFQKQGDDYGVANTYGQLGRIADERGGFGQAEEWYRKSLSIEQKQGDQHGAASTYPAAFLSYSRDDIAIAEKFFEASLDIDLFLWFDVKDVPIAGNWDNEIRSAIDMADSLVVLASHWSISSGYVRLELEYCIAASKPIHVVLIDNVKLPDVIRKYQYADFMDIRRDPLCQRKIHSLLESVKLGDFDRWKTFAQIEPRNCTPPKVVGALHSLFQFRVINSVLSTATLLALVPIGLAMKEPVRWTAITVGVLITIIISFILLPRLGNRIHQRKVSAPRVVVNLFPIFIVTGLLPLLVFGVMFSNKLLSGTPNVTLTFLVVGIALLGILPFGVMAFLSTEKEGFMEYVAAWLPKSGAFGYSPPVANTRIPKSDTDRLPVWDHIERIVVIYHNNELSFAQFLYDTLSQHAAVRKMHMSMIESSDISSIPYLPTESTVIIPVVSPYLSEVLHRNSHQLGSFPTIPVMFQLPSQCPDFLARLQWIDARSDYYASATLLCDILAGEHDELVFQQCQLRGEFLGSHPWPDSTRTFFGLTGILLAWHALSASVVSVFYAKTLLAGWCVLFASLGGVIFYNCYWKRSVSLHLLVPVALLYGISLTTVTFEMMMDIAEKYYTPTISGILVCFMSLVPGLATTSLLWSSKLRALLLSRSLGSDPEFDLWVPNRRFEWHLFLPFCILTGLFIFVGRHLA